MRLLLISQLLVFATFANAADLINPPALEKQLLPRLTSTTSYKVELLFVEVRNVTKKNIVPRVENKVSWDIWREDPGAKILMSPTLLVRANRRGTIVVGPLEAIKYLERDGNRFELREFRPDNIGLKVSVLVNDAESVKVAIESATLDGGVDGKLTIVGVDVPIGKPVVREASVETTVKLVDNQPSKIEIPTAAGKQAYMLMRVSKQ